MFVICRASFDSSAAPSKRKAQPEGEDTEEDVEEQKVSIMKLHGLKKPPLYCMLNINLIYSTFLTNAKVIYSINNTFNNTFKTHQKTSADGDNSSR